MYIQPCHIQTLWLQNIARLLYISQKPCKMWYPAFFSISFPALTIIYLHWLIASNFLSHIILFLSTVYLLILLPELCNPFFIISILFTRKILSINILQPSPQSSSMVWLIFLYVPIILYSLPHDIRIYAKYVFLR